jgi:hypothetical protein
VLLFFTSAVSVRKDPRNGEKVGEKIIKKVIYNWGLYIFIFNIFSVYEHLLGGVIME